MARLPRLVLASGAHHVAQRGHNGQPIVIDDEDRRRWRDLLSDAAVTHDVAVHAWALLDTGLHLVLTPSRAPDLSRMMQSLTRRYAAAFNRRHQRRGTLWEGRYRASLIEPGAWLLDLMRLVETLPAGPSAEPDASGVPSSSLAHHLGRLRDPAITEPAVWWALGNTPFEREAAWRQRVMQEMPPDVAHRLWAALQRGRPVGSPEFLERLSGQWAVPLVARPRGRPRKAPAPSRLTGSAGCDVAADGR